MKKVSLIVMLLAALLFVGLMQFISFGGSGPSPAQTPPIGLAHARDCGEAVEALGGEPLLLDQEDAEGWEESGPHHSTAYYKIPIHGATGSGTLALYAEMDGNVWHFSKLVVDVKGREIDLLACAKQRQAKELPHASPATLKKACDEQKHEACAFLGERLEEGDGVPKDETRAIAYHQRACDAGVMRACGNLGAMFLDGRGLAKDEAKGIELLMRACDAKVKNACKRLDERRSDAPK